MTVETQQARLPESAPQKDLAIQTPTQARNLVRELERASDADKQAAIEALRSKIR